MVILKTRNHPKTIQKPSKNHPKTIQNTEIHAALHGGVTYVCPWQIRMSHDACRCDLRVRLGSGSFLGGIPGLNIRYQISQLMILVPICKPYRMWEVLGLRGHQILSMSMINRVGSVSLPSSNRAVLLGLLDLHGELSKAFNYIVET